MVKERFSKRIKINQTILADVAKIDEFKGLWQGSLKASPQILGRLKQWVIITSTGASTRIEGAQMSDEEIARFLRGLKGQAPKSRDEQEVAGYADLLGRIFDNWRTLKLTENWILQFHDILLHFAEKDRSHRGRYKSGANTVVIRNKKNEQVVLFKPMLPHLVKPSMEAILDWTNSQLAAQTTHPLLVIANFIFEFLAIHPFKDGNGRLSRALTNLLLLKTGYVYAPYVSLDEVIEETKADYYLALRATQKNHDSDHEDITPWLVYFLGALRTQVERADTVIDTAQSQKLLSKKQQEILHLFSGGTTLGPAEISSLLKGKIPLPTIKQVLSRLISLRLLERLGQGRATHYRKTSVQG